MTMPSARFLPVLAVAMLAVALAGCHDCHEWNQKMTVVVETPRGERSGSSVVGIEAFFNWWPMGGNEVRYRHVGEATVVEASPGRYLFALLNGTQAERFYWAARDRFKGMERRRWLGQIPRQTEPVALTGRTAPILVAFTNINDPASVRRIDPDNLAAAFGPGYALKAITLEITKEPVTAGVVERVLRWLPGAGYLIPPEQQPRYVKDQTIEQNLMPSDFIDWQTLRELSRKS